MTWPSKVELKDSNKSMSTESKVHLSYKDGDNNGT